MSGLMVGFTGTQQGMTSVQRRQFRNLIRALRPREFHHGCCIGADAEAHEIVLYARMGTRLVLHPPTNMSKVAEMTGTKRQGNLLISTRADIEMLEAYDYMVRNLHIVLTRNLLIATPKELAEVMRSGTWSTIRRAQRNAVSVLIIDKRGKLVYR